MLSEGMLRKKAIFFGLDNVLIPGSVDPKVDMKEVKKILSNLEKLSEKNKDFFWALVSGYAKEAGIGRLRDYGLQDFFNEKNSFFVEQDYIEKKSDFDKEIHLKKLSENAFFQDEFFKKIFIEEKTAELGIPKEEAIFVGHDTFFDAFYLWKFGRIDCALLKEALSVKGKKRKNKIKGIIYTRRGWKEIQKLLLGKYHKPDYAFLESVTLSELKDELISAPEIKRLVIERKKQKALDKLAGILKTK